MKRRTAEPAGRPVGYDPTQLLVPIRHNSFCKKVVPDWKLLVCGGRDFDDRRRLEATLDKLCWKVRRLAVILGDCPTGADRLALSWATSHWHTVFMFMADWDKFGKAAGPRRNAEMAAAADRGVAFFDGSSPGTADMIRRMKALGKPVRVYRY